MKQKSMPLLYVYLFLSLSHIAYARNPDTIWTKTYGGNANEYGTSVKQTFDGGYILTGQTYSYGSGMGDVYLIRTNSSGDTIWTRTYGGPLYDAGLMVQQTDDSCYVVAGLADGSGTGTEGMFYLLKINCNGDTIWTHKYGGNFKEQCYGVDQTIDGGYILAGYSFTYGPGPTAFYVVKTDSFGDTLWTNTYGGNDYDQCFSVIETDDSGYIFTGITLSFGSGGQDVYCVKTDLQGDTLWTKTYGGTGDESGEAIIQTTDGGFAITGYTSSSGAGGVDVYIVRVDAQGNELWTKTYGGPQNESGYSIQETNDSGFIIVGDTHSYGSGFSDLYVIRTNSAGDTLWTKTYGDTLYDSGWEVQKTNDQGYIIIGISGSKGIDNADMWLLRTYPDEVIMENISRNMNQIIFPTIFCNDIDLSKWENCKIYDIMGRVVQLSYIIPGIYFIQVNGLLEYKIIKIQ